MVISQNFLITVPPDAQGVIDAFSQAANANAREVHFTCEYTDEGETQEFPYTVNARMSQTNIEYPETLAVGQGIEETKATLSRFVIYASDHDDLTKPAWINITRPVGTASLTPPSQ